MKQFITNIFSTPQSKNHIILKLISIIFEVCWKKNVLPWLWMNIVWTAIYRKFKNLVVVWNQYLLTGDSSDEWKKPQDKTKAATVCEVTIEEAHNLGHQHWIGKTLWNVIIRNTTALQINSTYVPTPLHLSEYIHTYRFLTETELASTFKI